MDTIPDEMIYHMIGFVSRKGDICSFACTSRRHMKIAKEYMRRDWYKPSEIDERIEYEEEQKIQIDADTCILQAQIASLSDQIILLDLTLKKCDRRITSLGHDKTLGFPEVTLGERYSRHGIYWEKCSVDRYIDEYMKKDHKDVIYICKDQDESLVRKTKDFLKQKSWKSVQRDKMVESKIIMEKAVVIYGPPWTKRRELICTICKEDDHYFRFCPRAICGQCRQRGHIAKDCKNDMQK